MISSSFTSELCSRVVFLSWTNALVTIRASASSGFQSTIVPLIMQSFSPGSALGIYCVILSNNTLIVVSGATPNDGLEMYKQRIYHAIIAFAFLL